MKKNRAAKIGSYVVSIMFLSMALFFVFLLLKNQNADQGRMVKIVIGALTFF
jgi:preprotein translocase subunit YajC